MPNVEFIRSRKYGDSTPVPIIKTLPRWYKDADKYNEAKQSTFKNCVPFFEAMSSGYSFITPCDVEFKLVNGEPTAIYDRENFPEFIQVRTKMDQFHTPEGYYDTHFHWFPEWGVSLTEGYSALYIPPINRYDLPFLTTSGIINNDKVFRPGNMPFFLKKGFEGVIPAGTAYVQIFPFLRENWESSFVDEAEKEQTKFFYAGGDRSANNIYRENIWVKPDYT